MKTFMTILFTLFVITVLTGCARITELIEEPAPKYPTFEELLGIYENATMTIEEIFLSDAMRASLEQPPPTNGDELDQLFECDLDLLAELKAMEGQILPVELEVAELAEGFGVVRMTRIESDTGMEQKHEVPFTYQNGILTIEIPPQEGLSVDGEILASYTENNEVMLEGHYVISLQDPQGLSEEGIRITISLKASKPL